MREEKAQIGMKLTCGFEMLLADPVNKDKKEVREIQLLLEDISSGEAELPSNEDIAKQQRQDDEKWLEIDYDDFEAELSGKSKEMDTDEGTAQDNLRKMVSRFQDFVAADSRTNSRVTMSLQAVPARTRTARMTKRSLNKQ